MKLLGGPRIREVGRCWKIKIRILRGNKQKTKVSEIRLQTVVQVLEGDAMGVLLHTCNPSTFGRDEMVYTPGLARNVERPSRHRIKLHRKFIEIVHAYWRYNANQTCESDFDCPHLGFYCPSDPTGGQNPYWVVLASLSMLLESMQPMCPSVSHGPL